MLIEYYLLRGKNGPEVGTARMENGRISVAISLEPDRLIVERFFNDQSPLARNAKLGDGSVYWALPGTRTWFEETVEQRLYYSAGYGYLVLSQPPASGYMILKTSEPYGHRRLERDNFDEWPIRTETLSPTVNAAALADLLDVWEKGFADHGVIERGHDARRVQSLLDAPTDWEIVHVGPPGSDFAGEHWIRLGIDVAEWPSPARWSILSNVDPSRLNEHGLVDSEVDAEAIRQWCNTEFEPVDDPSDGPDLIEIWAVPPPS